MSGDGISAQQKGFTLVELAIVLVIIGIILGAILKGQELINNAKVKRLYNQYRETLAAVYTYYDRYGRFPGDDPGANATRWSTLPGGITAGNGDGTWGGAAIFNCADGNNAEQCKTWLHLRLANIISGPTTAAGTLNPANVYGGSIGVGYQNIQGLTNNWIAFDNVPGEVALSLDEQYDDGAPNTGSIRTTSANYANTVVDIYFKL